MKTVKTDYPPQINKLPEITIGREFKICGQIGESGQKEKLSYTNLMPQFIHVRIVMRGRGK